jgi:hypothetical protein
MQLLPIDTIYLKDHQHHGKLSLLTRNFEKVELCLEIEPHFEIDLLLPGLGILIINGEELPKLLFIELIIININSLVQQPLPLLQIPLNSLIGIFIFRQSNKQFENTVSHRKHQRAGEEPQLHTVFGLAKVELAGVLAEEDALGVGEDVQAAVMEVCLAREEQLVVGDCLLVYYGLLDSMQAFVFELLAEVSVIGLEVTCGQPP